MAKEHIFSVNFFKKFLSKLGSVRVSYKAAEEFTVFIEDIARDLLENAKKYAEHAGRKTVLISDIRLAKKRLNV